MNKADSLMERLECVKLARDMEPDLPPRTMCGRWPGCMRGVGYDH